MSWTCSACGQESPPPADADGGSCPHCGAGELLPSVLPADDDAHFKFDTTPPEPPTLAARIGGWATGYGQRWVSGFFAKIVFLIAMMPCAGVGLLIKTADERPLAQSGPRTVTCRELIASGPGKNPYVVVTDFKFGPKPIAGRLALLPAAASDKTPARVLLETAGPTPAAEDSAPVQVQGMVTTASSLSLLERASIGVDQPGTDLTRCYILQEGKQPPSLAATHGWIALGVGMIVGGVVIWLILIWIVWRVRHAA